MKTIKLTQGKFALVDDADYEGLSQHKWYAYRMGNTFYAVRTVRVDKKKSIELMHRRILGLKYGDGKCTDHINGDGINNQWSNLRVCNRRENIRNQRTRCNNISGYKGVSWHKRGKKWQAHIAINYKHIYLGLFYSPLVAALAYNQAAVEHFGKFARLNIID